MPIYEYSCLHCNVKFEKLLTSRDAPVQCPSCDSDQVEKLMSVFGLRVGGGGEKTTNSNSGCSGCTSSSCANCR
jgi:putative FmdB family regulatory protein